MRCAYHCHEVGGPYIAENPDCPIHNRDAVAEREREEEERSGLEQRVSQLETELAEALDRIKALERHHIRY